VLFFVLGDIQMLKKKPFIKRLVKTILVILGLLVFSALAFFGIAYRIYYSTPAANLPCRNCNGTAQLVHVNGFDLYYRETGANAALAPIVLVHGGPGMSSKTFKDGFDFLSGDRRVIYYDQRGSGNSQIKPDPANYTIAQLVEELEALRREVIKADKIILVGHSAGGALAQRYALTYPEHVSKMILVGSVLANNGMGMGGPVMDAFLAGINILSGNLPPTSPEEADAKFQALGYAASIQRLYDSNQKDLVLDTGYVSFVTNREVTRSTLGGDFDPALRKLTVDTLLIYGAADFSSTGKDVTTHLSQALPNAILVGFDRSGHWPFLEEPAKFQQVLKDFLAKAP
jgi:proline iminopeptidase